MNIQQAYYELKFEIAFLKAKGDEFQTLFERLMGLAYKADFMACLPWGKQGDHKNDGFLKSERRLFQVYAPTEMTALKAVAKINADFAGAKAHWSGDFDHWVFAHNATEGLPAHVHKVLLDFEKTNSGIKIDPWGLEEFRVIFRKISLEDLESWFGPVPTEETKAKLGFNDLKVVIENLAGRAEAKSPEIRDVPMGKIEANALSESVATLLKNGMLKSTLVSEFLDRYYDETLGERLAEAFRSQYVGLRDHKTPNAIFSELQAWAGGNERGTAEHELAVLTVIAYFFERCDIFEEPKRSAP